MTGVVAQRCLEDCGIIVNMNRLPYDSRGAAVAGGIRWARHSDTQRNGPPQMDTIAGLVDEVLRHVKIVSDRQYELDESFKRQIHEKVKDLCGQFPMCA